MKITLSKRLLAVVIAIALLLSALNTYLILEQNRALQRCTRTIRHMTTLSSKTAPHTRQLIKQAAPQTTFQTTASQVINQALANGNAVYIKPGNYTLTSDVQVYNKIKAKIVSDGATIIGNGNRIIIKGDNYTLSQNNLVSGLTIINGTLRIENSFGTTVTDMAFVNCSTAIELANTATWTEGTSIENSRFANFKEGIAFRTPTDNGNRLLRQLRGQPLLLQPYRRFGGHKR